MSSQSSISIARRLAAVAAASLVAASAGAQRADTTSHHADTDHPSPLTWGTTLGSLTFPSGIAQQGVSAVARLRLSDAFAIGITPAYGHVTFPASLGGGSTSGMTDTPVELTFNHALPLSHSPVVGAGLAVTLPTGDTATGFGSGKVGYSVSAGVGFSPTDRLSLHAGAGRPLTDYSLQGALGGSATTWGDLSLDYSATDRVSLEFGFDGDIAGADTAVGASRALALGAAYAIRGPLSINANLLHGVSGAAARWSFTVGFGTDFAYLESLGSSSPTSAAAAAVGGQSHSHGVGQGTTHTHGKP